MRELGLNWVVRRKQPYLSDSDPRLQLQAATPQRVRDTEGQIFTGFFTYLAALAEFGLCSVKARPLLSYSRSADRFTLATNE